MLSCKVRRLGRTCGSGRHVPETLAWGRRGHHLRSGLWPCHTRGQRGRGTLWFCDRLLHVRAMLDPRHVACGGFDVVDVTLLTAISLALLLRLAGAEPPTEFAILWSCDALQLDRVHGQWCARGPVLTLAVAEVHACPRRISCLSWRSVRSCHKPLAHMWTQYVEAVSAVTPEVAAAVYVHRDRLRPWLQEVDAQECINLFSRGVFNIHPQLWLLPLWFKLDACQRSGLIPVSVLPLWARALLALRTWNAEEVHAWTRAHASRAPVDADSELAMLPLYFQMWSWGVHDGCDDGVALDMPLWAQDVFRSHAFTPQDIHLIVRHCTPFRQPLLVAGKPRQTLSVAQKITKWGRCPTCTRALQPWIYKSGSRAGAAAFVCSNLFSSGKKCFFSTLATAEQIAKWPLRMRQARCSLKNRLKRGGRFDAQSKRRAHSSRDFRLLAMRHHVPSRTGCPAPLAL